ncbi:MAG TPA: radical SAM protein [Thermoplasmatales archaeon]|nr:radical SAM protein [Thermoplasmatales archaeon]
MNNIPRVAFGPVPSRRLGRSLGINNIPPKTCTYSCVYCQLGRTSNMQVERRIFYKPEEIAAAVKKKIKESEEKKEPIDYLTFVPDGEPTLDVNLGREIKLLKPLGIKIAVITNASLMWREDVRNDLCKADWVSLKIDSADEKTWKRINRPHPSLRLKEILEGIFAFRKQFSGELCTETMLVDGINIEDKHMEELAEFIARLKPNKSYLSIPLRPPAEKWVRIPGEETVNKAYNVFKEKGIEVEYLIGYEEDSFASTGNIKEDILSITAVHPMREESVKKLVEKAGADWRVVEKLIDEKKIVEVTYRNKRFYMRNLSKKEL